MLKFKEFIIEKSSKRAVFIMGPPASGKSTLVQSRFSNLALVDIDDITFEIGNGTYDRKNVAKAIAQMKKKMLAYIKAGKEFVKPMLGANFESTVNGLKMTQEGGMETLLIYKDIDPKVAATRAKLRFEETGRGEEITEEMIRFKREKSLRVFNVITGAVEPNADERKTLDKLQITDLKALVNKFEFAK